MPPKADKSKRLPLKEPVLRPTFRRERRWLTRGVWPVAGCDEAGRGPLAGPVVAAAVILDPNRIPRGLNDSKKLNAEAREKLYAKICATAEVAVAFGSTDRIDRDNILRASLWALARAVKALPVRPRMVFVDGNMKIDCGCECEAVVSGDALVVSIAAASIVAKVTRDRLMARIGLGASGLRLRASYGLQRAGARGRIEDRSAPPSITADRSRPWRPSSPPLARRPTSSRSACCLFSRRSLFLLILAPFAGRG